MSARARTTRPEILIPFHVIQVATPSMIAVVSHHGMSTFQTLWASFSRTTPKIVAQIEAVIGSYSMYSQPTRNPALGWIVLLTYVK